MERDVDGFTHGKPEDKHGIRASNTAALFLEDVFVPAENMVGDVPLVMPTEDAQAMASAAVSSSLYWLSSGFSVTLDIVLCSLIN